MRVVDKVGNTPVRNIVYVCTTATPPVCTGTKDINEAPKGTGAYPGGEVDNPFKFTVDTKAPTVSTGKTGVSLKNPGVTSGDNKETEKPSDGQWVRVNFTLGTAARLWTPPR